MNIDFSAVKRAFQGMEARLASIRTEVQQLQTRREAIRHAPAHREDVKTLVKTWVAEASSRFTGELQDGVEKLARNPTSMSKPDEVKHLVTLGALGRPSYTGQEPLELGAILCAVLGPTIQQAAIQAIDAMEWPETAIPAARRQSELEALDTRIEKLLADEREIIEKARDAGLNLE